MKPYNVTFSICVALILLISMPLTAQVGINTVSPRTTLEVAKNVHIAGGLENAKFNPIIDGQLSTFLMLNGKNSLKSLNAIEPTDVDLAYIQEYIIEEPNPEWIKNFDTGIEATDYTVIVTSAGFHHELDPTNNPDIETNSSLLFASAFISDGTWHIVVKYPQASNLNESALDVCVIRTLIFSNKASKQFGTIPFLQYDSTVRTEVSSLIE